MRWLDRLLGVAESPMRSEALAASEPVVASELPAPAEPLAPSPEVLREIEMASLADCCVDCGKPAHNNTQPFHHSAFERADDKRSDYLAQRARRRRQAADLRDTTARTERMRAELARDEADDPRGFKAVPPQCDDCFRTNPRPTPRYCDNCGCRYEQPHGSAQNKCNACTAHAMGPAEDVD